MAERRKFRIAIEGHVDFDIVTTSPRRYLVIDTQQRWTLKRTDNWTTAYRLRVQQPLRRVILDTVTGGFKN